MRTHWRKWRILFLVSPNVLFYITFAYFFHFFLAFQSETRYRTLSLLWWAWVSENILFDMSFGWPVDTHPCSRCVTNSLIDWKGWITRKKTRFYCKANLGRILCALNSWRGESIYRGANFEKKSVLRDFVDGYWDTQLNTMTCTAL